MQTQLLTSQKEAVHHQTSRSKSTKHQYGMSKSLLAVFDQAKRVSLAGWKTTVQGLIDRFEDLNLSPPTPPTVEGNTGAEPEADGLLDEAAAAHHKALTAATRTVSGQDAQLSKLRAHFHKVHILQALPS